MGQVLAIASLAMTAFSTISSFSAQQQQAQAMGIQAQGQELAAQGTEFVGKAQKDAADYQAKVADNNARIAEMNAADAIKRGKVDEANQTRKGEQLKGRQKAVMGASGVVVGEGSSADILSDTAYLSKLDALTIRSNARKEADEYHRDADQFRSDAELLRMEGANAEKAGKMGAQAQMYGASATRAGAKATKTASYGTLLGGGTTFADRWQKYYG